MLSAGAVTVWVADLSNVPKRFHELLSADERERAERLRDTRVQERWSAARAVLRDLVGRASGTDPAALEFELGPHGKPRLRCSSNRRLSFNISHSGSLAIYALSPDREVGVDIEMLDALRSGARNEIAIARRMLGTKVAERLLALAPEQRAEEFLRAWVMHEAVVKCLGLGLGQADVEATRLMSLEGGSELRAGIWVTTLEVDETALAALAVRGGEVAFELNRWRP